MKITKRQLKRIIKEEKAKLVSEANPPVPMYNDTTRDLDHAIMLVMKQLIGDVGYSLEEAQEAIISYVTEKVME
tara:strand:- start:17 stop:238 length:222 start_codon:yes stop_codon:yes gene_type:complete